MCSLSNGSAGQQLTGALTRSSDADVGRHLVRRFEEAVADPSAEVMAALHAVTIALSASMRAAAISPERAVITLKALLRGHGGAGWSPSLAAEPGSPPVPSAAPVYRALFAWWVAAYFAESA